MARSVNVLVVDDDPDVIADYLAAFTEPGHDRGADACALQQLEADLFDDTTAKADQDGANIAVTTCSQGDAALDAAARAVSDDRPFDIVFLDVRMPPGMNGIETGRRLREIVGDLDIGIVTAQADVSFDEIARNILPPERLFFVRKPFLASDIRAVLNERLALDR